MKLTYDYILRCWTLSLQEAGEWEHYSFRSWAEFDVIMEELFACCDLSSNQISYLEKELGR